MAPAAVDAGTDEPPMFGLAQSADPELGSIRMGWPRIEEVEDIVREGEGAYCDLFVGAVLETAQRLVDDTDDGAEIGSVIRPDVLELAKRRFALLARYLVAIAALEHSQPGATTERVFKLATTFQTEAHTDSSATWLKLYKLLVGRADWECRRLTRKLRKMLHFI